MHPTLCGVDADRLERSCDRRSDTIRFGPGAPGVERAEVHLSTLAFERHRHDTYAIGITTDGVQRFFYRGSRHVCLPGQLHILYPDETHDGGAATPAGFAYRITYLAPELIREALQGDDLPFVRKPVQPSTPATRRLAHLLLEVDDPLSDLATVELVVAIADLLRKLGGPRRDRRRPIDERAVQLVHDYLSAHASEQTPSATLERIAGTDRFTIAPDFRCAYGTSPDRHRTLRRVDIARRLIGSGVPLARAAYQSGFADQSHLTRQFRRAYGLTPGRWAQVAVT